MMQSAKDTEWLISFYKELEVRLTKCERTVSIIIQGPLNKRSISTIPEYLKRGEVIVSCWGNDDLSLLDEYKKDIKIIANKHSEIGRFRSRPGSASPWVYQNYTTRNGLLAAKSFFSIKVRSDESYPNLDPLIKMLIKQNEERDPETGEFENRIITSNIYFRKDRDKKFHPSDHIIAGRTPRMIDIFSLSVIEAARLAGDFPEQIIGQAVINSKFDKKLGKFEEADPSRSRELMKKHFNIIRVSELPNHTWTSSYCKYDALHGDEGTDWCNSINEL